MKSLVMTLIGKDKPGLVESLSKEIECHGGNWEESRMCHLGGQFAGILTVRIDPAHEAGLIDSLMALDSKGLSVLVHPEGANCGLEQGQVATIELTGQDRPGIVHEIAAALARLQVNVEEFESKVSSAPWTGDALFHAKVKVSIPVRVALQSIHDDLDRIAADMMVDIDISDPRKAADQVS
jgi:glycine cleavage system regulatory protein